MLGELRDAIDAAAGDPRVVGIVITGNGRGSARASTRDARRHRVERRTARCARSIRNCRACSRTCCACPSR
jgi:enoyl-CoA hydratase/carnithine racemase